MLIFVNRHEQMENLCIIISKPGSPYTRIVGEHLRKKIIILGKILHCLNDQCGGMTFCKIFPQIFSFWSFGENFAQ